MFKSQSRAPDTLENRPKSGGWVRPVACKLGMVRMDTYARRTVFVSLLVLAVGSTSPASPTEASPAGSPSGTSGTSMSSAIVDLTNAERASAGVPSFRASAQLMQAAQLQADQMARLQRMEHEISGAQYPRPTDRLAAVGYRWSTYGENIAMGQTSAAAVMDSWMHSSGHRTNILNASFREIGVGFARDSAGRPYYVQVFGTLR